MKTIELNGFEELNPKEMNEANGGFIILAVLVGIYLFDHWDEVKAGYVAATK